MLKFFKHFTIFILFLPIAFIYSSCVKMEDIEAVKKQIDSLKQSLPSGIVLISYPESIVKGDTAAVCFRVNPSEVIPTLENIHLDGFQERVFEYYDSNKKDADTKAQVPYYNDSHNFKIISIEPGLNEAKDTLKGEWVARVISTVDSSANCFVKAKLALVMSFKDFAGKEQTVSSGIMDFTMVPTISEGINPWYQSRYSYKLISQDIIPSAFISIDVNHYKTANNEQISYSLTEEIDSIRAELDPAYKGVFTVIPVVREEKNAFLEFVPNSYHSKWVELENSKDSTMTVPGKVIITDSHNHTAEISFTFVYYALNTLVVPMEISTSPTIFDITEELKKCGFYFDEYSNNRRASMNAASKTGDPFYNSIKFDRENKKGEYTIMYLEKPDAGEYYDPEEEFSRFSVSIMPGLNYTSHTALEIKIVPKITVVE